MRIAYLNLMLGVPTGPSQKVLGQAAALDRLGVGDFDVIVLNSREARLEGRLRLVPLPRDTLALERGAARFRLFDRLVDCQGYDLLFVRYPGADPWGPAFVRRYPTVTEHHTKEIPEKLAMLEGGLRPAQAAHKRLTVAIERGLGPRIIGRTHALVGISEDVRAYEVTRARFHGPSLALPNGVWVDGISQTGFLPFDGRELHLAIVGSEASPWVGMDRLVEGLRRHMGGLRIVCHLVGEWGALRLPADLPETVSFEVHGILQGSALDRLLESVTLGVSSLALHRNQMFEGSPLKTREYVARGLPVITGYADPDLVHAPVGSFYLQVPADESPLAVDRIVSFAEGLGVGQAASDLSREMRDYARQHMDWLPKMERLVKFLRSV